MLFLIKKQFVKVVCLIAISKYRKVKSSKNGTLGTNENFAEMNRITDTE